MKAKINPFRPNSPVNPGMFVGRVDELDRLEGSLLQTIADQPEHFMITGERGIGKTSILMYLRYVAEGRIAIDDDKLKFLVIETDVNKSTTQLDLVKKIELSLNRQLSKTEPGRNFLKDAWAFLKRVRIMDSGFNDPEAITSEELLIEEFAYSLSSIVDRTCDDISKNIFKSKYDGVLILVDEADNSDTKLNIGSFFKLLLERLQRQGCNRVVVGLAGLPELREVLVCSHPSSLRIFEEIELSRLSKNEVKGVIDICIEKASKLNKIQISINQDALDLLERLADGYPHFIQQFGHSAFACNTDNVIALKDVKKGAFGKSGALELIGNRYYRNDFYNRIGKDSYGQVLRIMADKLDGWVTKKEIRSRYKGNESTLNNALKALRDRHIIISKEGSKGVYRLQHKGFALWIRIYADPNFLKDLINEKSVSNLE
ncbi:MAG: AAA family ATPase [Proteobacteria bacterium]|nr:AAA family ATPase [Pseudomonadota bacterium]